MTDLTIFVERKNNNYSDIIELVYLFAGRCRYPNQEFGLRQRGLWNHLVVGLTIKRGSINLLKVTVWLLILQT